MSQQSIRQAARRAALDGQSKRRRERAERDKRLDGLALAALVAVRERDAAVVEAGRRAGVALAEMTGTEGLSLREAVQWCGDGISAREATRLRRLVDEPQSSAEPEPVTKAQASTVVPGRPAGERLAAAVGQGARAAEGPAR